MGIYDQIRKDLKEASDNFRKGWTFQELEVTGEMTVGEFQEFFQDHFNTKIRVYKTLNTGKGSKRAEAKQKLGDIGNKQMQRQEITVHKYNSVGEIEDQFKHHGIGIQVMTPTGNKFAPNDMQLKNVAFLD